MSWQPRNAEFTTRRVRDEYLAVIYTNGDAEIRSPSAFGADDLDAAEAVVERERRAARQRERVRNDDDTDERAKLVDAIDAIDGYRVVADAVVIRSESGEVFLGRAGETDPATWRTVTLGGRR